MSQAPFYKRNPPLDLKSLGITDDEWKSFVVDECSYDSSDDVEDLD